MAADFVAGCFGGIAGVLVGHPFDTVKVRLQTQAMNGSSIRYKGTFDCFRTIVRQEGVFGLYKGMASPLMGLTFINAIVFGVQGNMMRRLGQDTYANVFLSGGAAGLIQSAICSPMELAKTRVQVQGKGRRRQAVYGAAQPPTAHGQTGSRPQGSRGIQGPAGSRQYSGSLECLKTIYRTEGLRGCARGMTATVLRETPSFGIYFTTYKFFCARLKGEREQRIGAGRLLLAGGLSGVCSWLATYPIDVVKSRLQADGAGGARPHYRGIVDCARQSVRAEGAWVFTQGLGSTLLRAFPVNAATFAVVSYCLQWAHRAPDTEHPEKEAWQHHNSL